MISLAKQKINISYFLPTTTGEAWTGSQLWSFNQESGDAWENLTLDNNSSIDLTVPEFPEIF